MRGPDGAGGWIDIECHGHQSNCFKRAADECPWGYDIAGETATSGSTVVTQTTGPHAWDNSTSVFSTPSTGDLFIKCHPAPMRHASPDDTAASKTRKGTIPCSGQNDCPWFGYQCVDGYCTGQ